MAEAFIVAFDITSEGTGSAESVKTATKFGKGETLPPLETVSGQVITVADSKLVAVEAETATEACKVAREAYGPNVSGVSGVCKKTNWEFKAS